MTRRQLDKLDTISEKLEALIGEVKDPHIVGRLQEAQRDLMFARRRADGSDS